MGQINNSSLLDTLIQKARGVGIRADGPITAERFLVCIIEESDQELLQMLTDAGLDLQSCKNRLLTYINNGEGNPLVDNIYMQNVLRQARSDAEKNNLAEITPPQAAASMLSFCSPFRISFPSVMPQPPSLPAPPILFRMPPRSPVHVPGLPLRKAPTPRRLWRS